MPQAELQVASLPIHGELTPAKWREIERYLEEWKGEVESAIKRHPARSYELGQAQIDAFLKLVGHLGNASIPPETVGASESARYARFWVQRHAYTEFSDALNVYVGKVKDTILNGLKGAVNPTEVAAAFYRATHDSNVNWRAIARTEMIRASSEGRLTATRKAGYDRVWVPPHVGACPHCKRLLENQDFLITDVQGVTNYGRPVDQWVPCIPLHPHCRHSWLPYIEEIVEEARAHYAAMQAAGFTDDKLDAMFDTSGQLRPEYADVDLSMFKMAEPYADCLMNAIEKVNRTHGVAKAARIGPVARPKRQRMTLPIDELRTDLYQREPVPAKAAKFAELYRQGNADFKPPIVSERDDGSWWLVDGQHRAIGARLAGRNRIDCDVRRGLSWEEEHELCHTAIHDSDTTKTDDDAIGLDTLLWDDGQLRREVRNAILTWWRNTFGADAEDWTQLYVTAEYGETDTVELHVAVDYPKLRAARREWRKLTDAELHIALVALARSSLDGVEPAPGVGVVAYVHPEVRPHEFERGARLTGRGVWNVRREHWTAEPPVIAELPGYPLVLDGGTPSERLLQQAVNLSGGLVAALDAFDYAEDSDTADERLAEILATYNWLRDHRDTFPFVWAFLRQYGPLDRVERLANPVKLASLWPEYTLGDVAKTHEPSCPGVQCWHGQKTCTPLSTWKQAGEHLAWHHQQGHTDVRMTGLRAQKPLHPHEHERILSHARDALGKDAPETLDVLKAGPPAANSGVEHWITIHPNGDEEKGQPVLVRNNADGSMQVIGGAGGHLNYLRLDGKRHVKPKADGEKAGAKDVDQNLPDLDQAVTPEEAARQQAEREQEVDQARKTFAAAKERRSGIEDELRAQMDAMFGKDLTHAQLIDRETGETVEWQERDRAEQGKLQRQIIAAALHTATYGEISDKDLNQALAPKKLKAEDREDTEPREEGEEKPDTGEEAEAKPRRQKFVASMTGEQANSLLELDAQLKRLKKQQSESRRVMEGDRAGSALSMEWSDTDVRADVANRISNEAKTDVARRLMETADARGKRGDRDPLTRAMDQGAYDTLDAVTHAVMGKSAIPQNVAKLLGVNGTAQLLAHRLRQQAKAGEVDLQKVGDALDALTDEREGPVGARALARARSAAATAVQMRAERAKTEKGEGLYTSTMTRSIETRKLNEASQQLGMAIAGFEAASALKVALRGQGEKIKVGGFTSAATARELGEKAGLKLKADEIIKTAPGDYGLQLDASRLDHLFKEEPDPDQAMRKRMEQIRTGEDLDREIEEVRNHTPGYNRTLSRAQAQGVMFLRSAYDPVLDFAPGVGKTDTAIAAALGEMADAEKTGGSKKAWIIAPDTALKGTWAKTIQKVSGRSVQVVGAASPDPDDPRKISGSKVADQFAAENQADFNVVSYETLRRRPELARALEGQIVITDEAQKAKNENTLNWGGVDALSENADKVWKLTGTPIEKNTGDLHAQLKLRGREHRGDPMPSRKTYREKFDKLGQYEQLTREEKLQQFRDGLSTRLFHLGASEAGNSLPEKNGGENGDMKVVNVPLSEEHTKAYQDAVNEYERLRTEAKESGQSPPSFGGRRMIADALYKYGGEDQALAQQVAKEVEGQQDVKFGGFKGGDDGHEKGANKGTYAGKTVVFGQEVQNLRSVKRELEAKGIKVFVGTGATKKGGGLDEEAMTSARNDDQIKKFLAHPGKAVFLTSDKNSTARSLQFGDNNGEFQHGATQMIHYQLPDNNATIQQREARIHRRGAQMPVETKVVSGNTPFEVEQRERLAREGRTQQLVGNAEDDVGGKETLRTRLRKGARRGRRSD